MPSHSLFSNRIGIFETLPALASAAPSAIVPPTSTFQWLTKTCQTLSEQIGGYRLRWDSHVGSRSFKKTKIFD